MGKLREILPKKLEEGLTPAEEKLLEAAEAGETIGFGNIKTDTPTDANKWGKDRTIRANLLWWLFVNKEALTKIAPNGISVIGAKIEGDLNFNHFRLERPLALIKCSLGNISLMHASTMGLVLSESAMGNFYGSGIHIHGFMNMRKIKPSGVVQLLSASIDGDLVCDDAVFDGTTISNQDEQQEDGIIVFGADGIVVRGGVFLKNVIAKGSVRLLNAEIGGILVCIGALFENRGKAVFSADGIRVAKSVFFDKVNSRGQVRFSNGDIGGDLSCDNVVFENQGGISFIAENLKVKRNVFFNNSAIEGAVYLSGTHINGDLTGNNVRLDNTKTDAFCAQRLIINGTLFLNPDSQAGGIDLAHTKAGLLHSDFSDFKKWPRSGKLILTGFEYEDISSIKAGSISATEGLAWLRLQKNKPFFPQPYEQLAKVFRSTGREHDAREVLMAKYDDMRKHAELHWTTSFWYWLTGWTVGYGYKPSRALIYLLGIFLFGATVFYDANARNFMRPIKLNIMSMKNTTSPPTPPPQYPEFSSIAYSLDTLVPFLDIHQQEYWTPATCKDEYQEKECKEGKDYRARRYLWLHICAGWFFSTLALLSFTGLLKKD